MFSLNIHRSDIMKLLVISGIILLASIAALAPAMPSVEGARQNPAVRATISSGPNPEAILLDPANDRLDDRRHAGIQGGNTVSVIDRTGRNAIKAIPLGPGTTSPSSGIDAIPGRVSPGDRGASSISAIVKQPAFFDCSTVSEIPTVECEALVALYDSADGANWSDSAEWLGSATPCSWSGVTCSGGQVSEIYQSFNQLDGSIPSELGNLAGLQELDLSSNQLTGSIPPELGNLAGLQDLDLDTNLLTGSIPTELGNLTSLEQLDLDDNQLTGSIPPELGNLASLQFLYLDNNLLSGSIPPELGNLASLLDLFLSSNQLTGDIPPELGNLADLQYLDLNTNQLSGSIPPELGNLVSLQQMDLNSNLLSGSIPPELGNLADLQYLDLDTNQLTGSIPPELGNLASLDHLFLYSNQLTGNIPPELDNLASLVTLDLFSNQLTGSIPPELGSLSSLQNLYLDRNQLSGSIPPALSDLDRLQKLFLSVNQLTGSIPPELGDLASLEFLSLALNQLTGSVPPELGGLASLQELYLDHNQLTGNIPITFISLDLAFFYFNETDLCELPDQDFQDWLAGLGDVRSTGVVCAVASAAAAEPSFTLYQDPSDGATGVKLGITRVFDSATNNDVAVLLDQVQARLSYEPGCLNLLEIRESDFTLADIVIDDPAGMARFTGTAPATGSAPFDLGHALTRLVGGNQQSCSLTMEITSLTDQEGNPITATGSQTLDFRRGDARADGVVNIADALYISQYLNGLRQACTDVVDTSCLHSVNAASVGQDGPFDQKTIDDANFVAEYLLGSRDDFYDPLPPPTSTVSI